MTTISLQTWMPLLFLAIGIYYAVMAWKAYQHAGKKTNTPLFKAKTRVAGSFIVVALLLLIFL
jgi:hypothetical protein